MGLSRFTPANDKHVFISSNSTNETQMKLFGYKNFIHGEEKYTCFQVIPQQKPNSPED